MIMRPKSARRGEDLALEGAADILEVDVDAAGAGGVELGGELGAVVEAGGVAQRLDGEAAFLGAAGDADGAGAGEEGELAGDGAHGAGGGGDDDGLAGLGLADIGHAEIGGEARHPEQAEGEARMRHGGDAGEAGGGDGAVLLPAIAADDAVAGREASGVGALDGADAGAFHDGAEGDRGRVGLGGAHAAAHVGVEREELVAEQDLAVRGGGDVRVVELEAIGGGGAFGAAAEEDLLVGHRGALGCSALRGVEIGGGRFAEGGEDGGGGGVGVEIVFGVPLDADGEAACGG